MATLRDARLREAQHKELLDRVAGLEAEVERLTAVVAAVDGAAGDALARDIEAVEWWLALVVQAQPVHALLPAHVAARIEGDAGRHELERLAPVMGSLSVHTRADVAATLERVAVSLRALHDARALGRPRLRAVGSAVPAPPDAP